MVRHVGGRASPAEISESSAMTPESLGVYTVQRHRLAARHSAPLIWALDNTVVNGRLNASELDSHRIISFLAGIESTVCAISNVLRMLDTDGKLLRRLQELGAVRFNGFATDREALFSNALGRSKR